MSLRDFTLLEATADKVRIQWRVSGYKKTIAVKRNTQSGALRSAVVDAGLADKFDWAISFMYNDATGFRKKDNTVSRRLAWKSSIGRTLKAVEIKRLEKAIKKAFSYAVSLEVEVCNPSSGYKGGLYVYLREKVGS